MYNNLPKLEPEDFYLNEQGYRVFTEKYHLKRGHCCKSGCKHCPFGYDKKTDTLVHAKTAKKNYAKFAKMTENELSYKIIGVAIEIHKTLGPGLLESAYESALVYDLTKLGFDLKQQIPMPFVYKGVKQNVGYRIDLLINNLVLIEIKSIEKLAPVHFAQTLTYLKLSKLKLGLLINFNSKLLKNSIHRVVNNL
jgi:GxxExxY protein